VTDPRASDAALAEDYEALRHGVGARLVPRDLIEVRGPDACDYLQGQCSQDVAALSVGQAADSLLLAPQGRVIALIRVTRLAQDAYLLDVDGGHGAVVRDRLARFKLRSRFEMTELDWAVVALRGARTMELSGAVGAQVVLPVDWNGWAGLDLLGPRESITVTAALRWCGEAAWEACRIEAGIPAMGAELDEKTIPAEAGLVGRAVSFTKGCYTGQELVARIDARGARVPRNLRGIVIATPLTATALADAFVGAELVSGEGERSVGRITSAAWSPGLEAVVALGYVHRSVAVPSRLELARPTPPSVGPPRGGAADTALGAGHLRDSDPLAQVVGIEPLLAEVRELPLR